MRAFVLRRRPACLLGFAAGLTLVVPSAFASYIQTNLVSDGTVPASFTDANLVNPWGISFAPQGPFWVSDNGTGVSTLYNGAGQPFPVGNPLVVTVQVPGGGMQSAPTGQVFNGSSDFVIAGGGGSAPSRFLFASEDGTIAGWNGGTAAVTAIDRSAQGAVYKGLALGTLGSNNFLYAANFAGGVVERFDGSFNAAGSFTDPNIPADFAPFNVQVLGGALYVTFAEREPGGGDDEPGLGNGFVDVFSLDGTLLRRLVSNGPLNSPWGLAEAPAGFGPFSNALLVGNFGDGLIHAFDPASGNLLGPLQRNGTDIAIDGLWGLSFGNGASAGDRDKLYFTAGIDGESHGLFGRIQFVSLPGTLPLCALGGAALLLPWKRRALGAPRLAVEG